VIKASTYLGGAQYQSCSGLVLHLFLSVKNVLKYFIVTLITVVKRFILKVRGQTLFVITDLLSSDQNIKMSLDTSSSYLRCYLMISNVI
jgi:hypothetical protein